MVPNRVASARNRVASIPNRVASTSFGHVAGISVVNGVTSGLFITNSATGGLFVTNRGIGASCITDRVAIVRTIRSKGVVQTIERWRQANSDTTVKGIGLPSALRAARQGSDASCQDVDGLVIA